MSSSTLVFSSWLSALTTLTLSVPTPGSTYSVGVDRSSCQPACIIPDRIMCSSRLLRATVRFEELSLGVLASVLFLVSLDSLRTIGFL